MDVKLEAVLLTKEPHKHTDLGPNRNEEPEIAPGNDPPCVHGSVMVEPRLPEKRQQQPLTPPLSQTRLVTCISTKPPEAG